MKKVLHIAFASCLTVTGSFYLSNAQTDEPIAHSPVKAEQAAHAQLFTYPSGDSNFFFRADLPGDNFLTIRFNRLGDWPEGGLTDVVAAAQVAWKQLKDSFVHPTAARKLALHLPASGTPVLASVAEWGTGQRTLLVKSTGVQPLRLAMDTIQVLKALPPTGSGPGNDRYIQYTFLLKDLSEMEGIASNASLVGDISQTFDSLVAATRKRWKRPDASFHMMDAQYDIRSGAGRSPGLKASRSGSVLDRFGYYTELGASFVAGSIAGSANLRLSYYIRSKGLAEKGFVALSFSTLVFASQVNDELVYRGLGFANIELGSVFSGTSGHIPLYRTSVGFGYRVTANNVGPYDFRYRGFFNYSVSRAVTLTPDFYIIPKDGNKDGKVFYGLTVSARLL